MGWITKALGLTLKIPTAGTKNWADGFLADFASVISSHNHTGSPNGNQISSAAIVNSAITTLKIADANVTSSKIADSNVTTAKIADSHVTTAKIADGNITTVKIAAGGVTATRLATDAYPLLIGFGCQHAYSASLQVIGRDAGLRPLDIQTAIRHGFVAPRNLTITKIVMVALGGVSSQNCRSEPSLYVDGVATILHAGSVTCLNNTTIQILTITGSGLPLSVSAGQTLSCCIEGGGSSGDNSVSIAFHGI